MASIGKFPCDEAAIRVGVFQRTCAGSGFWVLVVTILGSSMAFIDGTVVNVALPALQSDLRATISQVQWVVESLGDLYGRRRVFTIGVSIFAAASLWSGLAGSIGQLLMARGLQGVGGA